MFSWLRRKKEEPLEGPSREEIEGLAQAEVLSLIKSINERIPLLPYGTLPWMDWSERPPQLKLKKRRFDSDEIIEFHEQGGALKSRRQKRG